MQVLPPCRKRKNGDSSWRTLPALVWPEPRTGGSPFQCGPGAAALALALGAGASDPELADKVAPVHRHAELRIEIGLDGMRHPPAHRHILHRAQIELRRIANVPAAQRIVRVRTLERKHADRKQPRLF